MVKSFKSVSDDTLLVHTGRTSEHHYGALNTPVYRASTILHKDYKTFKQNEKQGISDWRTGGFSYGRHGNPTTRTLEESIATLEGGDVCFLTSSGVSAIASVFMAFLEVDSHVLVADSVYSPTRSWLNVIGKRLGVTATYFDPRISAQEFETLFTDKTKLVFLESPGSLTFELSDVPALSAVAHAKGAVVALDNTWGTPLYFKPFDKGVDVSIQAATKYIMGHSDGLMGTITCKNAHKKEIHSVLVANGNQVSGDDAYLAMRGLRTMGVRLKAHEQAALEIASWLEGLPYVSRVLHPALPSHPDYDLWKRDFLGSCGLFGFVMKSGDEKALETFIDNLKLFGLGYSWGGYESLVVPCNLWGIRSNAIDDTIRAGHLIRLHIGLETVDDLKADLLGAFEKAFNG